MFWRWGGCGLRGREWVGKGERSGAKLARDCVIDCVAITSQDSSRIWPLGLLPWIPGGLGWERENRLRLTGVLLRHYAPCAGESESGWERMSVRGGEGI